MIRESRPPRPESPLAGRTPAARRRQRRANLLIFLLLFLSALLLFWLARAGWLSAAYPRGAVCIDAGHGGDYTGAVYEGRQEKDDTLRLALAVRDELERRGRKVLMTRDGDENIGLAERTELANRYDAAAFVSLHRNSGAGTGVEIWVEHTRPEPDVRMAQAILDNLKAVGIQADRGVKSGYRQDGSDADYAVNRDTEMPSCLVEMGFLENEADNQLFDDHLEEYAAAIAAAVDEALSPGPAG